MHHDVIAVICHEDFVLELHFDDGKSGMLDCKPIIAKGGVFSKLEDPVLFKQVKIHPELGVLTWNEDIDIAPETVYSLATNSPLPEWMQESEKVTI